MVAKRKDTAGKNDERQARGKPNPPSQSRSEKNRRRAHKTEGGTSSRGVPKLGKHDSSRGGSSSGDGLH
jgi:hypothetical protein